jgi:hypothetical protein
MSALRPLSHWQFLNPMVLLKKMSTAVKSSQIVSMEGPELGIAVGLWEGLEDGLREGLEVGLNVGAIVGIAVGCSVGFMVGAFVVIGAEEGLVNPQPPPTMICEPHMSSCPVKI